MGNATVVKVQESVISNEKKTIGSRYAQNLCSLFVFVLSELFAENVFL